MIICKAETQDLKAILELQYLAYKSEAELLGNNDIPPLKQTLDEVIVEYENGIILKATNEKNEIIGSVRGYINNGTLFIGKLIVRPDMQGNGIGTKLLKEIETIYPQSRYELFTSLKSDKNIKLYERLGYVKFKTQTIKSDLIFIYLEKKISL